MEVILMNKEQIIKRLKEIADEIIKDGADVDALEKEANELRSSLETIEKRNRILEGLNSGIIEAHIIDKPEERNKSGASETDNIFSTPEYRTAFLKRLQGKELTDIEKRALTTAADSAGAAVPTTTLNMILDKMRQTSALFPRINVSYMPGNVSITVANAKNAAAWKIEGTDGVAADDTVINIILAGYELIKLVEISAAASAMTIDAFETYISSEVGRQMAIAVENAILNGDGAGEPTGILNGITWDANNSVTWAAAATLGYDQLVDGLALLPTMYHNSAAFAMNRKMLFGGVRKIKTDDKMPIFVYNPQDRAAMTILGYPVILDDYVPDNTILLGDFGYYYMNFAQPPTIEVSREAAFKSGKITYRGLAVADGKPALDEAFVKIYQAAV
jgi:HK97 family phage major capsid protein